MATTQRMPMPFPVTRKQGILKLQPLDERNDSPLFRRRVEHSKHEAEQHNDHSGHHSNQNGHIRTQGTYQSNGMSLGGALCSRCGAGFSKDEEIINSNGEVWHHSCFVGAGLATNNPGGVTISNPAVVAKGEAVVARDNAVVAKGNAVVARESAMSEDGDYSTIKPTEACSQCKELVDARREEVLNYHGNLWHPKCFVCAQCFRPFPEGVFYEFEGRKYCEHDFNVLFAPCCGRCKEFIIGRVIKAMNMNWHPDCFVCDICSTCLADSGYFRNAGRALCKPCNDRENAAGRGKYWCFKCHSVIEEGHLKFKGEAFHPYHFNCHDCRQELTVDSREKNGELYCLRCYDKSGIPICGACRRPIDGERIVYALGKAWHVEHFVCAQCEKPFLGTRHYEKKGLAYCEVHYHQLFGNICFVCNNVISGDVFSALNKSWCVHHFACAVCDKKMGIKSKFYEFDLKPTCRGCYEKFPSELKRRLKKAYDASPKK